MKNVLLIGSRNSGLKNNPEIMQELLVAEGLSVVVVYWEDLTLDIHTNNVAVLSNNEALLASQPELVIALGWYKSGKLSQYRDLALSVALFLESQNIPFWNREMRQQRSTSKLSTMMMLALQGLPVPRTLFSLNTAAMGDVLPRPFIAKAASASRGDNNFLVERDEDWDEALSAGVPMILQPFLPNDHDLRVICFNGEPTLVLRRSRASGASTHLNNTSQGGDASWLSPDSLSGELLTNCRKVSKITDREMAGIDLIPDSSSQSGYSFLEVNAVPQLTSGTDTTKKISTLAKTIRELEDREPTV